MGNKKNKRQRISQSSKSRLLNAAYRTVAVSFPVAAPVTARHIEDHISDDDSEDEQIPVASRLKACVTLMYEAGSVKRSVKNLNFTTPYQAMAVRRKTDIANVFCVTLSYRFVCV